MKFMLTVDEAVERLKAAGIDGVNAARLREGMKQGVFPFGEAIHMTSWVFNIYTVLVDKWIAERTGNHGNK